MFIGFAMPQLPMIASYADALRRGFSPRTDIDTSAETLAAVERDPAAYVASLADGRPPGTRQLPDGRTVPLLPMRVRWIWDGAFCGVVNLRWQPGAAALPDHVLGHIGYAIVPWRRGHGLAKRALRHMLSEAREVGLPEVTVATTADNPASQAVIRGNGGGVPAEFTVPDDPPGTVRLLYRIAL